MITGDYVDRVLKGTTPAGLPVERLPVFELVVNLQTARTRGVTVPQPVLLREDEVVQ